MKPPPPWLALVPDPLDADPELERLFAAAREAADPAAESRARVSAALASELSRAPASGTRGHTGGSARELGAQGAGRALARAGRARSAGWVALGGACTLALGFWLGRGVGLAEGFHQAAELLQRARAEHPAPVAPAPVAVELDAPSSGASGEPRQGRDGASEPGHGAPADARAAAPHASAPRAPAPRAPSSARAKPGKPAHERARLERPPAPAPENTTLDFRQVLEQLRRARVQLEAGQATASLLMLSELDRNAGELLREEREATRVLALCAAGQEEAARAAADRLRVESPRSIYAMRLDASCAGASAGGRLQGE